MGRIASNTHTKRPKYSSRLTACINTLYFVLAALAL